MNNRQYQRIVVSGILTLAFAATGCETGHRPSYEELKTQNEELESQLDATREKIQQAKSDLDDLKQQISSVEDEPCHEDSAGDLSGKADDVDSTLDEAEEDSN